MYICSEIYFSITIFFVLSFSGFAQNFSILGKVIDADNNPIELANVILLKGEEKEFLMGTSTDDNGYFENFSCH